MRGSQCHAAGARPTTPGNPPFSFFALTTYRACSLLGGGASQELTPFWEEVSFPGKLQPTYYCNLELFLPLPKNKTSNISQKLQQRFRQFLLGFLQDPTVVPLLRSRNSQFMQFLVKGNRFFRIQYYQEPASIIARDLLASQQLASTSLYQEFLVKLSESLL